LQVICLLNDCRRLPEEEELVIRDLAFQNGRILLVILTKLDKLNRRQRDKQVKAVARAYGLEPEDLILSGEKYPTESFWERIESLLQ
jgi:GTP-binding protein EngB required for normal cell division